MDNHVDIKSFKADRPIPVESVSCVNIMKPEFVEYVEGKSLTYNFPVLEIYANPRKSMQGGFICAAFDNTFGSLVILTTGRIEMVNLNFTISYHRPIFLNDTLTIKVKINSLGKTIVHLSGEAYDSKGKLIASAATNIMLLDKKKFNIETFPDDDFSLDD